MVLSPSCSAGQTLSLDGEALGKDRYSWGDGTSDAALGPFCCQVISVCLRCRHHQAEPSPAQLVVPPPSSLCREVTSVAQVWQKESSRGLGTPCRELGGYNYLGSNDYARAHPFLSLRKKTHWTIQHRNQRQSVDGNVVTTKTLT